MCFKRIEGREQLRKLKHFLNKNRMWICLDDFINAPECSYCSLIYQINYSYKCNKHSSVETFRNSILSPTFVMLEDIYREHKKKEKDCKTIKIVLLKKDKKIYIQYHFCKCFLSCESIK